MGYPSPLSQAGVFSYQDRDAINALIAGQGILSQGNVWWVRPSTGNDGNDGKAPATAFKTLAGALAAATAGQNDVVLLCAESNTAASTTDYQGGTLTWNKDLVHLIGVNAGPKFSPRSRLAFVSTYASATPLFYLTANDCLIAGIEFFAGVAQTALLGAVKVTGARNVFRGCHVAGLGHANNDIAGAYSLNLSGAEECLFDNCTIGLDTIPCSAYANSEILIDTATTRCEFNNCTVLRQIASTTNHPLVKLSGATAIDRTLIFKNCLFISESVNYATLQASVFKLTAVLTQGYPIVVNCVANSADNSTTAVWDVDTRNQLAMSNTPLPIGVTAGSTLKF